MPGGVPRYGQPKNPLLVRDDVGKAKPSCYDLPQNNFAYGRPGNHDQEGAREVSMFWVSHKPSPTRENGAPDFVWFNKRAASARVTTARDLAFYRKEHENLTPRYGVPRDTPSPRPIPAEFMNGFAYGKKVRPSTPIDEVISQRFAEQAEDDLKKFYTEYNDQCERAAANVRKIPLTTAHRGHASNAKKAWQQEASTSQTEGFKMKKFKNATGKVDSGQGSARDRKSAGQLLADINSARDSRRESRRATPRAGSQASERIDGLRDVDALL